MQTHGACWNRLCNLSFKFLIVDFRASLSLNAKKGWTTTIPSAWPAEQLRGRRQSGWRCQVRTRNQSTKYCNMSTKAIKYGPGNPRISTTVLSTGGSIPALMHGKNMEWNHVHNICSAYRPPISDSVNSCNWFDPVQNIPYVLFSVGQEWLFCHH